MDGIEILNGSFFNRNKKEKKKIGHKRVPKVAFGSLLKNQEAQGFGLNTDESETEASLEYLLDSIHELGEEIKKSPSMAQIQDYKKAVKGFIQKVLDNGFSVDEKVSGFNILKRKRFTLIQIIDQKLERIATTVLRNQKKQLDYLEKIDEIYGLLVDLLG